MTVAPKLLQEPARQLLKDVAFEHIKERIIDGTFAPGTFISERDLSADLSMSKTPIRAAFERLSEQGFVTIAPQRGVIVRELTAREIADHYDIRIALESFVVRELAGRLTAEQRDLVQGNLDLQREVVGGTVDVDRWTRADAEFHLMLVEFQGNEEILRTMVRQRDRLQRVVESIASRDPHAPTKSCAEHDGIFRAVLDGDQALAMRLVEQHLQNGKRFFLLGGEYGQSF